MLRPGPVSLGGDKGLLGKSSGVSKLMGVCQCEQGIKLF